MLSMDENVYAVNRLTGEFWNGVAFEGGLMTAKLIPPNARALIRATWSNVVFLLPVHN